MRRHGHREELVVFDGAVVHRTPQHRRVGCEHGVAVDKLRNPAVRTAHAIGDQRARHRGAELHRDRLRGGGVRDVARVDTRRLVRGALRLLLAHDDDTVHRVGAEGVLHQPRVHLGRLDAAQQPRRIRRVAVDRARLDRYHVVHQRLVALGIAVDRDGRTLARRGARQLEALHIVGSDAAEPARLELRLRRLHVVFGGVARRLGRLRRPRGARRPLAVGRRPPHARLAALGRHVHQVVTAAGFGVSFAFTASFPSSTVVASVSLVAVPSRAATWAQMGEPLRWRGWRRMARCVGASALPLCGSPTKS